MITKNIRFPKGDSKKYKIRVLLAGGAYLTPQNYGDVRFEVRRNSCADPIINKTLLNGGIHYDEADGYFKLTLSPNDTANLESNYEYDYKVKFISVPTQVSKTLVRGVFEVTD